MRDIRHLFALAALLGLTATAAAQPRAAERDCRDDRGVDRCAPAEHRRMLDLFGLLPVEAHVEAASQLRRVMYVDGYGRDIVAIVFIRPRAADPVLRIHFPRREDGTRIDPLEAPVPQQLWDDILFRSAKFDRDLAGNVPLPDGAISLCIHSWVFAVEAVDPMAGQRPATVRRRTEDACEDGLAGDFAWEAQSAAITLFPHCELLDPDLHRNPAMRLSACSMLSGDRLAAALVHNAAVELARSDGAEETAQRFDLRATLDWHGEALAGRAAAEAWSARLAEGDAAHFFLTAVHGETSDRVRVEGFLRRYGPETEDGQSSPSDADVTMVWTRRGGGDFLIESARVGPFATVSASN